MEITRAVDVLRSKQNATFLNVSRTTSAPPGARVFLYSSLCTVWKS